MLLTGVMSSASLASFSVHKALVAVSQALIGVSIGSKFAGSDLKSLSKTALVSIGTTLVLSAIAILFAKVASQVTGLEFSLLLLTFSPGGITEMTLTALGLGLDSSFVACHHLLRISFIILFTPFAFKAFFVNNSRTIKGE